MQIRQPQTPGIGGLKELTSAELAFIQGLAGGSFVEGDLFYYTAGAITRFPIGTNGQILSSDGTDPVWSSAGAGDMVLATIQTVTAAKTFNSGKLILAGATSGTTILNSGAIAGSSVLTLPVATDTLVGKATTDTFTNKTFDADGTGNSITNIENADIKAAAAIAVNKLAALTASEIVITDASGFIASAAVATYPSLTELTYVKGVTSAIQTQLGTKAPTTSPTFATSITGSYLTASEILITDGSKNIVSAAVATYPSLTELTYLKGVTSAIQTQIGTKAPTTAPTFATSITGSYLTASEMLITDGSKNIVSAAVATYPSLTELTYVKGVTSAIQTQLNARLPLAGGTMSGNITLGENTSIALDPAGSADGKYSGTTVTGTGGATIAFGDLVTLDKDDSRWELVDISVAAAATGDARGIIGIAVTSSSDGGALTILLNGIIRADANFPALTIGAAVYASTTGDIVVAQPTTVDYVIRVVGHALTADEIYFNPENDWITHIT